MSEEFLTEDSTTSQNKTEQDKAVRLENISKEYNGTTAVDSVSLNVREHEFLTLLGPSGTGKTTLLHIIAGFVDQTDGKVIINDQDVTDKPPYERDIGMVFQDMALFPHMSVKENIAFPLNIRRMNEKKINQRVEDMLDLIRLPSIGQKSVSELSGGQQQRVAIARALSFKPSLLLLDEPLSSLDKNLREEMRQELLRIQQETSVTTVHVTHNQEEALIMADRIAVMRNGQIEQHSHDRKLYEEPATPFVAQFVGDTNMFEGKLNYEHDNKYSIYISELDESIIYDKHNISDKITDSGDSVKIGVRYEDVQIGNELTTQTAFQCKVTSTAFKGDQTQIIANHLASGKKIGITKSNTRSIKPPDVGEKINVGWNSGDCLIYT